MKENYKIYFSHGKESGPYGRKITAMIKIAESLKINYESIDYTKSKNPEERIYTLLNSITKTNENIILVGSSMGGYVSANVAEKIKPKGLFLMAPAFYLGAYKKQEYNLKEIETLIIHGLQDDIVPAENSLKFAKNNLCKLYYINDNHSLSNSVKEIEKYFLEFLLEIID